MAASLSVVPSTVFQYLCYFILFFYMATVSAVLQPCRTCHMLFVPRARCVVCVLGKWMMMMMTIFIAVAIHNVSNLASFKRLLKTELYNRAYHRCSVTDPAIANPSLSEWLNVRQQPYNNAVYTAVSTQVGYTNRLVCIDQHAYVCSLQNGSIGI